MYGSPMIDEARGWALVTGATGGLGREFCAALAREGWRLALAGRSEERLAGLAAGLEGPRVAETVTLASDLSAPGAAEELAKACDGRGIEVGLLVNNAGFGLFGPSVTLPAAKVEAMIALNVSALTCLCAAFGSRMKRRGRGAILNVGSVAGNQATPYFASYAATKSYVLSYSLALRAELSASGVAVSCLLPGYVRTGFDDAAGIASEAYKAFSRRNGSEPAEVVRAGLAAIARNRPFVVAGGRNKIAAFATGLLPRSAPPVVVKAFMDRLVGGEGA